MAGLFAGIGGIELGLHRAGHSTTFLCETDRGAIEVLRTHFDDVPVHQDVRTLRDLPKEIELVTAGFPCQDLSQAGMTRGLTGANSGLVGEVVRLLRRRQVPWVLLENVSFMLQLARGRALDFVLGALEDLGYRWAYRVVDTRSFGLPQRRERVFILASLDGDPRAVLLSDDVGSSPNMRMNRNLPPGTACGFYWTEGIRGLGWAIDAIPTLKGGSTVGIPSPPAILLPSGDVVTPALRDAERLQGFRSNWTKPAERAVRASMRWKLVGNAVSVPVARWIGERLVNPGSYAANWDEPLRKHERWPRAAWGDRDGRFESRVSASPTKARTVSLQAFLRHSPAPLSVRATAGFLARTRRSSLRFPDGFLPAVEGHLERISSI